jgi:hypothetical protein
MDNGVKRVAVELSTPALSWNNYSKCLLLYPGVLTGRICYRFYEEIYQAK